MSYSFHILRRAIIMSMLKIFTNGLALESHLTLHVRSVSPLCLIGHIGRPHEIFTSLRFVRAHESQSQCPLKGIIPYLS
jgi:hypothetical protein